MLDKRLMLKELLFSNILVLAPWQFPQERNYVSMQDIGYKQYEAISIHNSNTYSLTFDDGPHEIYTPKILDILKKHKIKATFFMVTSRLNEKTYPILKRILDEGHIAASHHHEHFNNNLQSLESFTKKLTHSIKVLNQYHQKAGYSFSQAYYRFPYAAYGKNVNYHHMNVIKDVSYELFNDNCINFAFWDIDSGDWIPKMSSNEVFQNLKSYQEGGAYTTYRVHKNKILKKKVNNNSPTKGGVILFHDIQKRTVKALSLFLNYANRNDLSFKLLNKVEEFKYDKTCKFKGELK